MVIIDAGGRGAALADSYGRSENVDELLVLPGNDLVRYVTRKPVKTFPGIGLTDIEGIVAECRAQRVALVDVCQDNAVDVGVANALRQEGIAVVGQSKEAGIIESDKAWCREFIDKIGLYDYQPIYYIFESEQEGIDFVMDQPDQPWFIKAAGLAEGKAALAAPNKTIAADRISQLKRRFPKAAEKYLVEEWLLSDDGTPGEEFSYFAMVNGREWKFLGSAQDHKTVNNREEGDNTGGMGCANPPMVMLDPEIEEQSIFIMDKVVEGMANEVTAQGQCRELRGVLYGSFMKVIRKGQLQVKIVEFNARLGDPEAECILPGNQADLFELSMAVAGQGDFSKANVYLDHLARVVVTGASRGYPDDYSQVKGKEIFGLGGLISKRATKVYGAGVKEVDGRFLANGGRLFHIVGEGQNILEARAAAYGAMSEIYVEGNNLHYRTDIGFRDMARYYSI